MYPAVRPPLALLALVAASGLFAFAGCDAPGNADPVPDAAGTKGDAGDPGACSCGASVCGTDPCGNPCGTCPTGDLCVAGACEPAAACDTTGFVAASSSATLTTGAASPVLRFAASAVPSKDRLTLEVFQGGSYGGPTGPGTFDLTGSDYGSCGLCLTASKGCSDAGCARTFLADAGRVHIDTMDEAGGRFTGRIEGARLREVYIDPKTFASIPLPNGDTWCLPELAFDETVQGEVVTETCVPAGEGTLVGDRVADFTLTNCLGETRSLHSRCGQVKAVWIAAVAGWCEICSEKVPQIAAYYEGHKAHGLDVMIVLGEDQTGAAPTRAYCEAYAEAHGVDPAVVWMDNGPPSGGWQALWSALDTYSPGTIGLPWEALLRGSDMRYLWNTKSGNGDLSTHLEPLLAK